MGIKGYEYKDPGRSTLLHGDAKPYPHWLPVLINEKGKPFTGSWLAKLPEYDSKIYIKVKGWSQAQAVHLNVAGTPVVHSPTEGVPLDLALVMGIKEEDRLFWAAAMGMIDG